MIDMKKWIFEIIYEIESFAKDFNLSVDLCLIDGAGTLRVKLKNKQDVDDDDAILFSLTKSCSSSYTFRDDEIAVEILKKRINPIITKRILFLHNSSSKPFVDSQL